MGTTLTGTTPQDTYDSLIKVTDNGPLSGSLKTLTDGLGNDSALALSTGAASITGTLAVSGNAAFDTNTLFVDAAANEVGIGTATPSSPLDVVANNTTAIHLRLRGRAADSVGQMELWNNAQDVRYAYFAADSTSVGIATTQAIPLTFGTNTTEQARITSAGVLQLTQGQIKFPATQVASADANTLDDYEEGEWTMGVSFGGGTTGITYGDNTGTYTKIGRQVTVNGYIYISNKGSSTGAALITGLPFTQTGNLKNLSAASAYLVQIDYVSQYSVIGNTGTYLSMYEITEAGVSSALTDADFANNSEIAISFTYFV